jgi:predicted nucleotidyltransferase
MKIEFFYSEFYFKQLNKYKSTKRTWSEVKKIGQVFEKLDINVAEQLKVLQSFHEERFQKAK